MKWNDEGITESYFNTERTFCQQGYIFFETSAKDIRIACNNRFFSNFGVLIVNGPHIPQPEFDHDCTEGLQLPPWERRDRFGFLNGLYLTLKDVLLVPGRFFHRMPSQVGVMQPLLFAVVLGAIGTFIAWLYSLVSSSLQLALFGDFSHANSALYSFLLFIFSPVLMTVGVFIQAALIHAVLLMTGGNRLGFEATFRVSAYSEATTVLLMLPICGSWVAIIWSLVILIIGLYNIHEIDPWKAVLVVVAPLLLCFMVVGGSIVAWMTGLT